MVMALSSWPALAKETTITVWSHYANDLPARKAIGLAVKKFDSEHPNAKVKIHWYQKDPLYAAEMTAMRANKGPDILYLEPPKLDSYVSNGFLAPLNKLIDWKNVQPWARKIWTVKGKTYALPFQAFTIELYYNKKLLHKLGYQLPADKQYNSKQFLQLVKKARAAGITPIVQGIADRPYPGTYMVDQLLLRELGPKAYGELWHGKLSFKDPRVMKVFRYVHELVKAGAYPRTFASMTLAESRFYFHTKPQGLMLPMGSWYTQNAFNPPSKGGQPKGFELGIMRFPSMPGGACDNCKDKSIDGSYAINANSKHKKLAAEFLNIMATPWWGHKWFTLTSVQSAMKPPKNETFKGKHATYFKELEDINQGRKWFIGKPLNFIHGSCRDTYIQVFNQGLPAGLMSPGQVASMMNSACYKQ